MRKKRIRFFSSVQTRITAVVAAVLLLVLSAIAFTFQQSRETVQQINEVFASNAVIMRLGDTLAAAQTGMHEYLSTKSSASLENFYRNEQELREMTDDLNDRNVGSELLMLEKNIRLMTQSYLTVSEDAIQARRGRNVEGYKAYFAQASTLFEYINNYIYALNSRRFSRNTENYLSLMNSMRIVERMSLVMIILASAVALLLCVMSVRAMIDPLRTLSAAAESKHITMTLEGDTAPMHGVPVIVEEIRKGRGLRPDQEEKMKSASSRTRSMRCWAVSGPISSPSGHRWKKKRR